MKYLIRILVILAILLLLPFEVQTTPTTSAIPALSVGNSICFPAWFGKILLFIFILLCYGAVLGAIVLILRSFYGRIGYHPSRTDLKLMEGNPSPLNPYYTNGIPTYWDGLR